MNKSMQKLSNLNILFILDPLAKLDLAADTSMGLMREFALRGHKTWSLEVDDLWLSDRGVFGRTKLLKCQSPSRFPVIKEKITELTYFDLILIRKEPPFDERYLAMTYAMDLLRDKVVLSNDSLGIRSNNEKLSSLFFKAFMPPTLVSHDPQRIMQFARQSKNGLVVKPLDLAGGTGVFRLDAKKTMALEQLNKATNKGKTIVIAQEFIRPKKGKRPSDKRVILINGKLIAAYERRCKPGEFRANLHKGGTFHACTLNSKETKMLQAMGPYFRKAGLDLVGLDIIQGKLIEINVTCPGGVLEAEELYPKIQIIKKWADFLERKTLKRQR